jgi:hypothetical protein
MANIKNNDKIELTYSVETGNFYYIDGAGAIQVFSPPLSSTSLGYTEYSALLTQTFTSAPVATVLSNTLSATPEWGYTSTGIYTLTLADEFTASKTQVIITPASATGIQQYEIQVFMTSASVITLNCFDADGHNLLDGRLAQATFIVRVYN